MYGVDLSYVTEFTDLELNNEKTWSNYQESFKRKFKQLENAPRKAYKEIVTMFDSVPGALKS